ncbi:MAG: sn-glycerol-1-phosphate dehydrogenase, partial [Wolbachia endosymbiont of Andrena agilissima]|nr:sn-glycerol-1-phosphate dehydrogenase [Wolbachia endosymbiont of Andrena agilissima]
MHYLKQILHQTEQTFLREVITDYHLADDIYEICTQHGNDIFLVADENTAKLLNKNVFNKISHLIIPTPPAIPVSRAGMTSSREMTPSRAASLET